MDRAIQLDRAASVSHHHARRSPRPQVSARTSFRPPQGVQLGSNAAGGGDNVDADQKSLVQAVDPLTIAPDALKCVLKSVNWFAS
jgi:hypothetical protein